MRAGKVRAVALAAGLTAVTGREARTEELPGRVRVTAALPERLTEAARRSLLTALADADRYGHDVTARGAVVRAEIDCGRASTRDVNSCS
ncbi:hypothetical protein QFZ63_004681 [Streptomyces sp. B3I7]|uniref:hypothetical protein n=1 Tax=Streptomyces sp. B3I7 TaxID=3042269 RepID=UPI002782E5E9|nr:hypothetical protein [Streptomyces sp. B3I7]MDQ0812967.1 hypothetical protein [Streptomyces sp. B3I7]